MTTERQAINIHLHRMHDGFAASGSTLNRMVQHDNLHADGPDGVAGRANPHAHNGGDLNDIEEFDKVEE